MEKNLEIYFMCILLTAMTIVMFIQVIARYIFSASMQWPDEFCRYCFVTIVWFGCSYCVRFRSNLRVDSLLHVLPKKAAFFVDILVDIITIAFYVLMSTAAWNVTLNTQKMGSVTPSLEIPQYLLYGLMFLGFMLAVIRGVQIIVIKFLELSGKSKPEDTKREVGD